MSAKIFFDKQNFLTSTNLPKERRRYTYYDLIAFAENYHKSEVEAGDKLDETDEDKCVCEHKSTYKKVRFGVRLTKCRKCRQILSREQIWFNDK